MDAERGMADLLNRAVATIEAPTHTLIAGAATRGRTLRRRRRIVQTGSGVALVGLIAGIAVAVWPSSDAAAPGALHDRAPAATTHSARSQHPKPADDGPTTITPQVLLQRTLALLPSHATTSTYTGRSFAGWVGAEFVYDDGAGAAQIDVAMGFVQDGISGKQDPCGSPGNHCQVLGDGSHLLVYQGPDYSQGHQPYNATQWSVDLVRTDGVEVSLAEWNSRQEKDAPITRTNPPLSIDQLTAIARNPGLTPQVDPSAVAKAATLFRPHPVITRRELEREAEAVNQARAERAAARNARASARARERAAGRERHRERAKAHSAGG